MKKIIALMLVIAMCIPFAACDTSIEANAPDVTTNVGGVDDDVVDAKTEAHVHEFDEWEIAKEATCTADGEQTRICTSCKFIETKAISAGHSWKNATCVEVKTCLNCGLTEGELADHNWVDATYRAPKTCSVCSITDGEALVPGVSIAGVYVQLNTVAGAEPYIYWKNDSGKTIKYITFTAVPYNAVDDIVASSIGNKTYVDLQVTGPIGPAGEDFAERGNYYFIGEDKFVCVCSQQNGEGIFYYTDTYAKVYLSEDEYQNIYRTSSWSAIWYNGSIRKVTVTKIYVEYMDGTTETINNPVINNFYFHD